jgi:hypothetical protein
MVITSSPDAIKWEAWVWRNEWDRRRPPHIAAGGQIPIPPVDHPRRVILRGLIGCVVSQISC